ncbi:hypothetical protein CKAN_00079200 [Cinnamomum micranthum f. kanehirae]|uniref:Neprosin PEP catalytic domain-containing protein n=1 Tax=Cinnamomum micranthum f. kanehirae TaxID=337451 RepID=A0A3S3PTG7_9MAGN|nr:hypothetical protein CKAN_00079200 [Cinnamomum micranthum f. kanehirae]
MASEDGDVIDCIDIYRQPAFNHPFLRNHTIQDQETGNWWWMFGDEGVGYWPSSLFGNTFNHSSLIEWEGEVINTGSSGQHTTTQMGSGHFSSEGFGKSGHFRNILVVDFKNNYRVPDGVKTYTDKPQCYDLNYNGQKIGKDIGYAFYFGGPGHGPNCP